jgi:uncharacterized repeat protein (TIGR01451 family)
MASHQARRLKLDVEALETRAVPALLADLPFCDPIAEGDFPEEAAELVLCYGHDGEEGEWVEEDWHWEWDWQEEEDWDWSDDAGWYWEDEDWWWGGEEEWDESDPSLPGIPPDLGTLPWLRTEPWPGDRWYIRPMMPIDRGLVVVEVSEGVEPWLVTTFCFGDGDTDGLLGGEPPGWDEFPGEGSDPWDGTGDDEGDGEVWALDAHGVPDVAVQVIGPSGMVRVGRKFVFTIIVSNRGTADAQQIELLIGLPSKTGFESVSSEVSLTKNGRSLTGTLDHLGAGEQIEITVTLRARRVGSFALTASASPSSPDENLSDNTAVGYYYSRYAGRALMRADLAALLLLDRRKGS